MTPDRRALFEQAYGNIILKPLLQPPGAVKEGLVRKVLAKRAAILVRAQRLCGAHSRWRHLPGIVEALWPLDNFLFGGPLSEIKPTREEQL
jgi:hypothetical protein